MIYGILFTVIILVLWWISGSLSEKDEYMFMDRQCTDIMKGFAILCIVMCHMMGTFGGGCIFHSARRDRCFYILDFISIWTK